MSGTMLVAVCNTHMYIHAQNNRKFNVWAKIMFFEWEKDKVNEFGYLLIFVLYISYFFGWVFETCGDRQNVQNLHRGMRVKWRDRVKLVCIFGTIMGTLLASEDCRWRYSKTVTRWLNWNCEEFSMQTLYMYVCM